MKHAVKHLRFPETSIEAVTEFRQVAGQMLGADAMVDAPEIAFRIGDQGMDPGQDLGRFLPRTGHQPLMMETGSSIQEALALPAVGLDHRLGRNGLAGGIRAAAGSLSGHGGPGEGPGTVFP